MILSKPNLALAGIAILALGACTNPASLDPDNANKNRNTGLGVGALVGAGVGAMTASNPAQGALIGAAVGAAAGGIIGNELDKQAAEIRNNLSNQGITVRSIDGKLIVTLPEDITFASGSAAVRPQLDSDIRVVAENLVRYPNSTVQVIGNTDNTGEAAYNQALSEQRAGSVANILQSGGVSSARIQTIGRGEDAPIASNLTPEGRARNRRVDIVVLPRS
jgi:outer membrane protein OmpA-like peptidoglycan-associated protein